MEFKRFLVNKLTLFFMLSTLIALAISLIGSSFDGEARFGYELLLAPPEYAALCLLPTLVTWSRRELSAKALLGRKALMFALLEAEILFIAFRSPAIDTGSVRVVLSLAGSVLAIFVLVNLFLWVKDSGEAQIMNRDLERFQTRHRESRQDAAPGQ